MRNRIETMPWIDLFRIRFNQAERESIIELYEHGDLRSRRLAFNYLNCGEGVRANRRFIFDMCDRMIPDLSHYVRWQALIMLGSYAQTHATVLWPLVLKWGTHRSMDIRQGVGVCILEHILEYHFDPYFDFALEYIEKGNERFEYTLGVCVVTDISPANERRLKAFQSEAFPHIFGAKD